MARRLTNTAQHVALIRRAQAFAAGHVRTESYPVGDRAAMERGWLAGYRAALRDARKASEASRRELGFRTRALT